MIITDLALRRMKAVLAIIVFAVLAGYSSYMSIPREADPDITIPWVLVVTPYSGTAPADIETLITIPLEKKLRGLKGATEISSTSAEGSSMIMVEFDVSENIDDALQRVRDKVDEASADLPDDLENSPEIMEINVSEFPIVMVSLSGDIDPVAMKRLGDEMQDAIESVPGVLEAVLSGDREREILVEFDPDRLALTGLDLVGLVSAVNRENVNVPGGTIDIGRGRYLLRVPSEFTDPSQLMNLVVATVNEKPVRINDIAVVKDSLKDAETSSRLNGRTSLTLAVKKRAGANIIEVAGNVSGVVDGFRQNLSENIDISITMDQSEYIEDTVSELENSIITGLILVVAVLFFFIGKTNALFVALAIPFSMLISFIVLAMAGISLNMVVLFSLILALGMLVDNGIVIVENVFRHLQMGKSRMEATRDAVTEVGWPVITSTLTTVAAFFPMLFWPGIMGEFMRFLPLVLIITLVSSLFVALVFTPVLTASFMRTQPVKDSTEETRSRIMDAYETFLRRVIRRPKTTAGLAAGFLVMVIVAYGFLGNGVELFPETDPEEASVNIEMPQGAALSTTDAMARQVEDILLTEQDIEYVVSEIGVGEMGSPGTVNRGRVTAVFRDKDEREESSAAVVERIRTRVITIPGARFNVVKSEGGPPAEPPVNIEVSGADPEVLGDAASMIEAAIRDIPGLVDLDNDFVRSKPEIRVRVDRERAAMLGLSSRVIADTVKGAFSGWELGTFRDGDDEYDITARLPIERRSSVSDITLLPVPSISGKPVPLGSAASVETGSGFGAIKRLDGERVVTVSANAEGRTGNEVLADVVARIAELDLPGGVGVSFTGEQEEQDETMAFLGKAFVVALLMIFIVLIVQFDSYAQPLIVLSSVVLSLGGVFFGLMVTATPFSIVMTGVGVISLAGVVVNNAIVLIDYTNQLRAKGMPLDEAIVEAGRTRLRPVLLTAATTILGLLPMALGISIDVKNFAVTAGGVIAPFWRPMAVSVIFGLLFATVLTLGVVPALYRLSAAFGEKKGVTA